MLQQTVQWEDHLEEAFERKLSKYTGQVNDCQQSGWRAKCLPVEVGCRGFAAWSLASAVGCSALYDSRRGEPSTTPPKRQRGPQDGCGFREEIRGGAVASMPSEHKLGSDHSWMGHLDESV